MSVQLDQKLRKRESSRKQKLTNHECAVGPEAPKAGKLPETKADES